MATFTLEELNLAVEIHQLVKRLNSLMKDAEGLGLDVALRVEEREEVIEPGPGTIQQLHDTASIGVELRVLVFKAILVEAADATSPGRPDAILPHGWMG